jgi:hypothetical protein
MGRAGKASVMDGHGRCCGKPVAQLFCWSSRGMVGQPPLDLGLVVLHDDSEALEVLLLRNLVWCYQANLSIPTLSN